MGEATASAAACTAFGDDEVAAAAAAAAPAAATAAAAAAEPSGSRGKGRSLNTNFWQDSQKHKAAEAKFDLLLRTVYECELAEEGSAVEVRLWCCRLRLGLIRICSKQ
jgi:hypothetical protein